MDPNLVWGTAEQLLLFVVLITAAVTDLMYRKVYNWLTLPAFAFGLAFATVQGGLPELGGHLLYAVLPAFVLFGLFVWTRQMAGGDLKLMVAIAAVKGAPFIYHAIFWSAMAGALVALAKLIWEGRLWDGLRRSAKYAITVRQPKDEEEMRALTVPYGVAISFGTLFAWFLIELEVAP